MSGRDYVLPEEIRSLVVPVLAHRVTLDAKSKYGGVAALVVIEEILESVAVPR